MERLDQIKDWNTKHAWLDSHGLPQIVIDKEQEHLNHIK